MTGVAPLKRDRRGGFQTRPWLSQPVRLPKSLDGFPGIVIDGCAYDFEQAVPRLVYGREEGGFEEHVS